MLGQFFFWAGLASVAAFFANAALLGFGFFVPLERSRLRLGRAQTVSTAALFLFSGLCAWMLRERLAPWASNAPPESASAVAHAMRETMSVMLLGLSSTVGALLCAFAWIRLGRAGAAFRSLVWAFPAVRLVTGCATVLDYFGAMSSGADSKPTALIAVEWPVIATELQRGLGITAGIAATLFLLSWPIGRWLAARSGRPTGQAVDSAP